jgi:hypothetical protein
MRGRSSRDPPTPSPSRAAQGSPSPPALSATADLSPGGVGHLCPGEPAPKMVSWWSSRRGRSWGPWRRRAAGKRLGVEHGFGDGEARGVEENRQSKKEKKNGSPVEAREAPGEELLDC